MLLVLPLRKQDQAGVPLLTLLVCATCLLVFPMTASDADKLALAFDPSHPQFLKMFSSAFVHGDLLHLAGNLFFFYCFAGAIERGMTVKAYLLSFAVFAVCTDLAYMLLARGQLPSIGLSGVVSGYMGMFLVRYPRDRIECLVWYLWVIRRLEVPGLLFVLSFVAFDIAALRMGDNTEVNYAAHVSGFVAGVMLKLLFWGAMEKEEEAPRRLRRPITRR